MAVLVCWLFKCPIGRLSHAHTHTRHHFNSQSENSMVNLMVHVFAIVKYLPIGQIKNAHRHTLCLLASRWREGKKKLTADNSYAIIFVANCAFGAYAFCLLLLLLPSMRKYNCNGKMTLWFIYFVIHGCCFANSVHYEGERAAHSNGAKRRISVLSVWT